MSVSFNVVSIGYLFLIKDIVCSISENEKNIVVNYIYSFYQIIV